MFCKSILFAFRTLSDIIRSFTIHITSDLFKLINTVSVICAITAIVFWISIATKDDYIVNEDATVPDHMIDTLYSQIQELGTYKSV